MITGAALMALLTAGAALGKALPRDPVREGSPTACGLYSVRGVIRHHDGEFQVVVNEGTRSETRLRIQTRDEMHVAAYLDYPVSVQLKLPKRPRSGGWLAQTVGTPIELRIENRIGPHADTGFELLKALPCAS